MGRVREKGTLVLTNLRLLFVEGDGASANDYRVALDVPLGQVFDVSMGGLLIRYVTVGTSMGNLVFHLQEVDRVSFDGFKGLFETTVGRPLAGNGRS